MRKLRILLILVLIIETAYLLYKETNDIVINVQEIEDQGLGCFLGEMKVIQISDLHVTKLGSREKKLIEMIEKINPELIFFTGDFVSDNQGINPCINIFKQLATKRLVIAILGNSDHSYKNKSINTKFLLTELKKVGIKILKNESLKLTIQEKGSEISRTLYIAGLDDNYLWLDDIFTAMNNVPKKSPKILLAHSPNIIEKVNTEGINLILSGHTHGGQICIPFIGAIFSNPVCNAKKKYVSGLYKEDTQLYVNRGIGTAQLQLRLFCKPEITLFKFKGT